MTAVPLADLREAAGVVVTERRARLGREPRLDRLRDVTALLLRGRRDAGHGIAVGSGDGRGVADGKDVRMAGHGQVGFDFQTIGAVGRRAEPFGGARGAHAGGPDDGPRTSSHRVSRPPSVRRSAPGTPARAERCARPRCQRRSRRSRT